jgi:outer membrane protein OmpA-like peptidoglycan-associated protein
MYQLLLLTLFLPFSLLATIQPKPTDYFVLIQNPYKTEALSIIERSDGTLSIIGFSEHVKKAVTNNSFSNAFEALVSQETKAGLFPQLITLSNSGSIIDSRQFTLYPYTQTNQLFATLEGKIVIGGVNRFNRLQLLHLNPSLEIGSHFEAKQSDHELLTTLLPLRDQGYIALGTIEANFSPNTPFANGLGQTDIVLRRFAHNGHLLWKKHYGGQKSDLTGDLLQLSDGSIILAGFSNSYGTLSKTLFLMRLDLHGNQLWFQHYPTINTSSIAKLLLTPKNELIVLGNTHTPQHETAPYIARFTLTGKEISIEKLSKHQGTIFHDATTLYDGSIIAVGQTNGKNINGAVFGFTPKQRLHFTKEFGGDGVDTFHAITPLRSNGFALTGATTSYGNRNHDIWVLKLHDDGTFMQKAVDSKTYTTLYAMLLEQLKNELNELNISLHKNLTFSFAPSAIYFDQGSATLKPVFKQQLQRFFPQLLDVLLNSPFKDRIKEIQLNGFTSSEWQPKSTHDQRFLNNAKLSTQRAFTTVEYLFNMKKPSIKTHKPWLRDHLSLNGLSYRHLLHDPKTQQEDKIHSRRVEISVILY